MIVVPNVNKALIRFVFSILIHDITLFISFCVDLS